MAIIQKGCVCMPFNEINVKSAIEEHRENDNDFKEAWDSSKMEYALIGQLIAILPTLKYPISKESHNKILAELSERHERENG